MNRATALLALSLVACSEPRSAIYFQRHAAEATAVLARCAAGSQRGRECETAAEGRSAAEREARLKMYRRSFKGWPVSSQSSSLPTPSSTESSKDSCTMEQSA